MLVGFLSSPATIKTDPTAGTTLLRLQRLAEPVRRHRKARNTFAPIRSGCVR